MKYWFSSSLTPATLEIHLQNLGQKMKSFCCHLNLDRRSKLANYENCALDPRLSSEAWFFCQPKEVLRCVNQEILNERQKNGCD